MTQTAKMEAAQHQSALRSVASFRDLWYEAGSVSTSFATTYLFVMQTSVRIHRMTQTTKTEAAQHQSALRSIAVVSDLWNEAGSASTSFAMTYLFVMQAFVGVILASAELLERDLVCGSAALLLQDSSDGSEESHSPCHCHLFGPAAYQTMIISTAGEIALNPVNILSINLLGRRLCLCITMGCTALFFLLLNICTSSAGMVGFLFMLHALVSANFNTIYIYTAEVLMSASFVGALCLFSSVCIICAISAVTLPIETKGRALQQVK